MWKADGRWPVRAWIAASPKRSRIAARLGRRPVVAVDQAGRDGLAAPVDEDDRRALAGQPDRPDVRGPAAPAVDAPDEVAERADRRRAPRPAVLLGPARSCGAPGRVGPAGLAAGAARRGRTRRPARRTCRRRSRASSPGRTAPAATAQPRTSWCAGDLAPLEGDQGAVEDARSRSRDPGLIAIVRPSRRIPPDSWMWPCSPSRGWTSSIEVADGGAADRGELDLAGRGLDAQVRVEHRRLVEAGPVRRDVDVDDRPLGSPELAGRARASVAASCSSVISRWLCQGVMLE